MMKSILDPYDALGAYMTVVEIPNPGRKTRKWQIDSKSSGAALAKVYWYGSWRQYVMQPFAYTVFNVGCLRDISEFLDRVNVEHRDRK